MKQIILVPCVLFAFISLSCSDDIIQVQSPTLYDAAVMPKVIFTYPAHNSTGPYSLYAPVGSSTSTYFKLQFNKLMNTGTLSQFVSISGFSYNINVSSDYDSYYGNSNVTGLYSFYLRDISYKYPRYEIGKKYTVTVGSSAEDIHGNKLNSEYSFSYVPEPAFRITRVTPKGEYALSSNTINVYFNSPVSSDIFSKITISPTLKGVWQVSTSDDSLRIFFTPDNGIPKNILYKLAVSTEASDKKGNKLPAVFESTFRNGTNFLLTSMQYIFTDSGYVIGISFNDKINLSSVLNAVSITPPVNSAPFVNSSGTFLYYYPTGGFPLNSSYQIYVDTTAQAINGSFLVRAEKGSITIPAFSAEQSYYFYQISRFSSLEMKFNDHLDTNTIRGSIKLRGPGDSVIVGKYLFEKNYVTFIPESPLNANTNYVMTASTSLRSRSGDSLSYEHIWFFKTY